MDFRIKLMGTVVAGGAILGGAGWGLSSGDDRPLQGSSRDRATEQPRLPWITWAVAP